MKKRINGNGIKIGKRIIGIALCIFLITASITAAIGTSQTKSVSKMESTFSKGTIASGRSSNIINVPGEYSTIQDAIDAAQNGDEVVVAIGTYTGDGNRSLTFNGRAITVRSTAEDNFGVGTPEYWAIVEDTIIDCNGTGSNPYRAFNFSNDETRDSIVSGFTIQNGVGPNATNIMVRNECTIVPSGDPLSVGGAILCDGASPTIEYCVMKDNKISESCFPARDHRGAAIYCRNASPIITNCSFENNGHIALDRHMSIVSLYNEDDNYDYAEIKNCTFTGKNGIGIAVDAASPRIVDCEFNDGTSDSSCCGIYGIELYHTDDVQIEHCKINNYLCGIHVVGFSGFQLGATISNCTILGNARGIGLERCTDVDYGECLLESRTSSTFYILNSNIIDSERYGIDWQADYGSLVVSDSTIQGSGSNGIMLFGSTTDDYDLEMNRCKITANAVGLDLWNVYGTINNSWIVGNIGANNGNGAGIISHGSHLAITSCTIAGTTYGYGRSLDVTGASIEIINSILWNNNSAAGSEIRNESAQVVVSYSDVRGGWDGEGNINADPKFVNFPSEADGTWNQSPTYDEVNWTTTFYNNTATWEINALVGKLLRPKVVDNVYHRQFLIVANDLHNITVQGKLDNSCYASGDSYQIYDYHLQWNPLEPEKQSLCVDAGDLDFIIYLSERDIDGQPRVIDINGDLWNEERGPVDMGGDEFCLLGDMNCDGQVNAFDIDPFVLALTDPNGYAAAYPYCNIMNADCNCDGAIDSFDIDPFVELVVGG